MPDNDIALFAHLMRRAGFGATRTELEEYVAQGYEALVEDLVQPERFPDIETDVLRRYFAAEGMNLVASLWIYRMVNTQRPLQEKMTLFWHHVFATGLSKTLHIPAMAAQNDMFRRVCLSDFRTILMELSRDPAMIFWLDNSENYSDRPNENYGRELLELFSMGVGNYTESDLKNAARAFTGWSFTQPIPLYPHGQYSAEFIYKDEEHDDSVKTFLGETGRFNGEDIVDIVVKQPATARFVARLLYTFFVADEPPVPAWSIVPPRDPDAIETLAQAYVDTRGEMRSILRTLFNSDFFKEARFERVKSPAELVVGAVRLAGAYRSPEPAVAKLDQGTALMGQILFDPPTVEGWHTGKEWVDMGTLNERVNFAVDMMSEVGRPGVQDIVNRLEALGIRVSPEAFVDTCLDLVGPLVASEQTKSSLMRHAQTAGELRFDSEEARAESSVRIAAMLQLIVASTEYQFA